MQPGEADAVTFSIVLLLGTLLVILVGLAAASGALEDWWLAIVAGLVWVGYRLVRAPGAVARAAAARWRR